MEAHKKIAKALTEVWEKKDYDLLMSILDADIEWFDGPYEKAITTPSAVVKQWQKDLKAQNDIKVKTEVLTAAGNKGCYRFNANWQDTNRGLMELDGVYYVELSSSGKVRLFNQWYTLKPE